MRNEDVEEKLNTALSHAAPDVLGKVLSRCDDQEGKVIAMDSQTNKRKRWIPIGSVAAVMLLVAGSVFGINWKTNNTVDSIIAFDVNPSIQLQVNSKEQVIKADAINRDGEDILDGMNLKGTDLNIAVNALIGSMMKNGYIDDLANSILITVDNQDEQKGIELQKKLVEEINQILSASSVDGAILSQNLTADEQLEKLAKQYNISAGKAALIQNMVNQNSLWKFEDLSKLTINELNLLAESKHTQLGTIAASGTASDKAYIGTDKAKQIALSHAGVAAKNASFMKAQFDWDDGRAEYEVEFYSGTTEYEYDIDAITGDVRNYKREAHGAAPVGSSGGSTAAAGSGTASGSGSGSAPAGTITQEKAQAAALSHAGVSASQASYLRTKLDYDDGRQIYEVEFYSGNTEYDYDIDATNGKVLSFSKETDDHGYNTAPAQGNTTAPANTVQTPAPAAAGTTAGSYIGETKAQNIALAKVPGASVTKTKLDNDDGRMVYEVDLRNGRTEYEFKIDAGSGAILEWESDEDD